MDYEVKNVNNNEEDVMELNPEEFKDRLYESINNDIEEMVQPVCHWGDFEGVGHLPSGRAEGRRLCLS